MRYFAILAAVVGCFSFTAYCMHSLGVFVGGVFIVTIAAVSLPRR